VVDDGLDGQAYNRYSYVTNNPLRYTDPSGYRRSGHARSAGVALFALIVFNVAGPVGMPTWLWSAIQGATVGAVGTGSSSGAAWGAVSGLTFHQIGSLKLGPEVGTPFAKVVTDGGYWAKVSLHAATGGALNELQGGDFGHGFVTAGVSAGVSPLIDTIGDGRASGRPARIVVQALVGGAVSKGIGGDFGAGALLAAIGRVMNAESALSELDQGAGEPRFFDGAYVDGDTMVAYRVRFAEKFSDRLTGEINERTLVAMETALAVTPLGMPVRGVAAVARAGVATTRATAGTLRGLGNIGSHDVVDAGVALGFGAKWLGAGYKEIAPGVFRSADGLRQFRMTNADTLGRHGNIGPHVHFEALNDVGRVVENLHLRVTR